MVDPYRRIVNFKIGGPILLVHFDEINSGTGGFVLDNPSPGCATMPPYYCLEHEDGYFVDSSSNNNQVGRSKSSDSPYSSSDDVQLVSGGKFGLCARAEFYYNPSIYWPHTASFNVGVEDFTVDFWGKFSNLNSQIRCVFQYAQDGDLTTSNIIISVERQTVFPVDKLRVTLSVSQAFTDSASYEFERGLTDVSYATWHHIAMVRSGDTLKAYLNGNHQCTIDLAPSVSISSGSYLLDPDFNVNFHHLYVDGRWNPDYTYIDELHMEKGAKWTGNFTPPDTPY